MRLSDRIRNAFAAFTRSAADLRRVVVRPQDRYSGRYGRENDATTVLANYRGYLGICARIVANAAADTELRLYVTEEEAKIRRRCRDLRFESYRTLTPQQTAFVKRTSQFAAESHGDVVEVRGSRYERLIQQPCDPTLMTGHQFERFMYLSMLLPGNGYAYLPTDESTYMMLPMLPQHVGISADDKAGGLISHYHYGRDLTRAMRIPAEEVIHYRYDPDFNPYFGRSPAFDIITHAQTQLKADLAELHKWDNYSRPDYVAKIAENVPESTAKGIREKLEDMFGGATATGRMLVGQGLDIQTLSFSSKDMEYAAGAQYNMEATANAYQVPLSVLRRDSSNRATAESGDVALLKDAALPLISRKAEQDTNILLPRIGYEPGEAFVLFSNPVPEDVVTMRTQDRMDVMAGTLTASEYRDRYGEDLDTPTNIDAANVLRVSGVPLGQAETQVALPPISLAPRDAPEPTDGVAENVETLLKTVSDLVDMMRTVARTAPETASRAIGDVDLTPTDGMREEAQRGLDWRAEYGRGGTEVAVARARSILNGDLSPETVRVMVGWFARHEVDKQGEGWSPGEDGFPSAGRIAWALWGGDAGQTWANDKAEQLDNAAERAAPEPAHTRADDEPPQLNDNKVETVYKVFAEDLETWVSDSLQNGIRADGTLSPEVEAQIDAILDQRIPEIWKLAAEEVGNNFDADLSEFAPSAEVVETYKASVIKTLSETLQEDVQRAIGQGIESGKTAAEVVRDIMEFAPEDYPKYAAERIARTETAYALESGAVEAMAEVGVEEREFQLSIGACPVCVAYESFLRSQGRLVVPIGEPFARAGQTFNTPEGQRSIYRDNYGSGVHPNCRCSFLAVIEGVRHHTGAWLMRAKRTLIGEDACRH